MGKTRRLLSDCSLSCTGVTGTIKGKPKRAKRGFFFTKKPIPVRIFITGKTSNHSPLEESLLSQPVWVTPKKPTDLAEEQLLAAILNGSFPIGGALPPERELAQALGITRPTLREALQRLSRDGWIEIHQGKSTIVADFWKDGNLIMLNALSRQPEALTPAFILNLLEVRAVLAPAYSRLAFARASKELADFLEAYTHLADTPEAYAQADQELHHQLTLFSGNPIFTLIYNGFRKLSFQAGLDYFASAEARGSSREYYEGLLQDALHEDADSAASRTAKVMQDSLDFWQKTASI